MPRMIDADDALEKIEKIYEEQKNSKNEIEMFVVLGSGIKTGLDTAIKILEDAPTIKAYTVHEVAEILADLFGDRCACNYNNIDDWLPSVCSCANSCPDGNCWERYLYHLSEKPKR